VRDRTEDIELRLLVDAVLRRYHYDFRGYSFASLKRRLTQARERFGCRTFSQLQDRVLHDEAALPELLSHLTVQVSELFRDPAYFRAVRDLVVPHLRTYPSLKVWVAGCSAGEDLYSLAILFHEEGLEERTLFYGTDINPETLKKTEQGVYEMGRIPLFTENHRKSGGRSSLSDYYTAAYGAAVFDKSLRRRPVFSDHSLVSDQVFAEVQLVSCRNVLIYFDRDLQDRAVGLFKDSLVRKGFLGLGAKESLRFSKHADAFTEFARDERIYQRGATHDGPRHRRRGGPRHGGRHRGVGRRLRRALRHPAGAAGRLPAPGVRRGPPPARQEGRDGRPVPAEVPGRGEGGRGQGAARPRDRLLRPARLAPARRTRSAAVALERGAGRLLPAVGGRPVRVGGRRLRPGGGGGGADRRQLRRGAGPEGGPRRRRGSRSSREAGFDFHLTKPVELRQLEELFARVGSGP
jgi:chemotaxis protein methyltransferase CheR